MERLLLGATNANVVDSCRNEAVLVELITLIKNIVLHSSNHPREQRLVVQYEFLGLRMNELFESIR
jgi:hypothetical protein